MTPNRGIRERATRVLRHLELDPYLAAGKSYGNASSWNRFISPHGVGRISSCWLFTPSGILSSNIKFFRIREAWLDHEPSNADSDFRLPPRAARRRRVARSVTPLSCSLLIRLMNT